jgi:ABC-2 type transport system permease protein
MIATVSLLRRLILDRRRILGWTALGAAGSTILQIAFYPSVRDSFADMTDALPEAFFQLIGSDDFSSPEGFLQAESFGTYGPLLVLLVTISVGASSLAGTEQAGFMHLIATSPIPRSRIALAGFLAMAISGLIVTSAIWLAIFLAGPIGDIDIATSRLTAASTSLLLLGLAGGALSFGIGGATGKRGLAVGITSGVVLLSFLTYGLFPLADSLADGRYVSLWYPYAENTPLENGLRFSHVLGLVTFIAICTAGGVMGFGRRDLQ